MKDNKDRNVPVEHSASMPASQAEMTRDLPVFTPSVDIYEKEDALLVLCDLPGVPEDKVDIGLENDVLTITGQQTEDSPENSRVVHRGYRTGIYRRAFTLTTDIDRDKIKARLSNGVLSVTIPKAEHTRPRKIAIEAE